MRRTSFRMSRSLLGIFVLALVAAACGGGASAAGGDGMTLRITAPKDGATVSSPFTAHVDASVPLGDPSTGEHHVHLCFDGGDCDVEYTLVYGNDIVVKGLSPGQHTIEASLRNADHSDTGVSTQISVTVRGDSNGAAATSGTGAGATGSSGASGSTGKSGGGGYSY